MPVYQYEGVHYELPDGLTNEQAISKIKGHLGQTSVEQQKGILDSAVGVGEAGLQLATGALGGAVGWIPATMQKMNDPDNIDWEKQYAANMERMTYAPRTEKGQEYSEAVGDVVNRYLMPVAPILHTFPSIKAGESGNAMKARFSKEKNVAPDVVDQALSKQFSEAPAVAEIPKPEMKKAAPLTKEEQLRATQQQYEQLLREQELQRESAFNRPDTLPELTERQSPMERMASDLGAEKPVEAPKGPMVEFAKQLEDFDQQSKGRPALWEAERSLEDRQRAMEQEVAQRASLDYGAAERARQEQASPISQPAADHLFTTTAEDLAVSRKQLEAHQAHLNDVNRQLEAAKERVRSAEEFDRVTEAQRQLEARQSALEEAMRKQVTLERNAFERSRQEKAPAVSEAARAHMYATESAKNAKWRNAHQPELFEGYEHGYGPNPYDVGGQQHWVTDEHGIPVRSDLTMEAQNLENPLQRNLWGDELTQKHEQEAPRSLTEAIDSMGWAQKRGALRKTGMIPGKGKQSGKMLIDWGKKDAGKTLSSIPGFDGLRSSLHALIRSPEEAIGLAKQTKDVAQNAVQKGFNLLTKGGIYLKQRVDNPVVHFTVDRFLDAEGQAKAEVANLVHDKYLKTIRSLSASEQLMARRILDAADKNAKDINVAQLRQDGIPSKVADFVEVHQSLMKEAFARINQARIAAGQKPISERPGYSAFSMSGDFRKVVTNAEGQVVGVISANTMGKLKAIEAAQKVKDPTLQFGNLRKTGGKANGRMVGQELWDTLELLGENNPHIQELLQASKEASMGDVESFRGMAGHTMQKKGVWGMEGRKPWESAEQNTKDFFDNQVKYLENSLTWGHLAEAAGDVNKVLREESVVKNHPNAVDLSDKYMTNALGMNNYAIGNGINQVLTGVADKFGFGASIPRSLLQGTKSVANTALLSLNPAFLALQLLQPITSVPGMTSFLRGRGGASGIGHFAKSYGTWTKVALGQELSAMEKGAVEYARKNHVYASDMIEHSSQTSKNAAYYANKVTQAPAAHIEKATRAQVYMTFVHMLNDSGLTPTKGLYEQAQRATDMAMNHYGDLEKPQFYKELGQLGSAAYNLQSYKHNELSRWSMFAREAVEHKNLAPLLTQMGTTMVVAGVAGLPFFNEISAVYDNLTEALGRPRSLIKDVMEMSGHLSQKEKYALSHGAPSIIGVNMSPRLGIGDVVPNSLGDAVFPAASKVLSMGKAAGQAVLHPTDPEYLKAAAYNLAPPVAQGPMQVGMYQNGDLAQSTKPYDTKAPIARRNASDEAWKMAGFTGMNESAQRINNYENQKLDKAYADIRTDAMNKMIVKTSKGRDIADDLKKYFDNGQGDPDTFNKDLIAGIQRGSITANEAAMLKAAASKRIPSLQSAVRRAE